MADARVYEVEIDSTAVLFEVELEQTKEFYDVETSIKEYDLSVESNEIDCTVLVIPSQEEYEVEPEVSIQIAPSVVYTGDYEVIPSAHDEIVLPTAGYVMADDVTVHKIQTYETHNEYGSTFYIAEEV